MSDQASDSVNEKSFGEINAEGLERLRKALMRNPGTTGAIEDAVNDMFIERGHPFVAEVIDGPLPITSPFTRPIETFRIKKSWIDKLLRRPGKRVHVGWRSAPGIAEFAVSLVPTTENWRMEYATATWDARIIIDMARPAGARFDGFRLMPYIAKG
jgi:hypothetical protein